MAVIALIRDISERKQAEKGLQPLTRRLQLVFNVAAIGVWEWDIRSNIQIWDDSMYQLFGLSKEVFLGDFYAWRLTVHPEDIAKVLKDVKTAIKENKDLNTEYRIVRPDGAIKVVKCLATIIRDDDNSPLQMIGINQDVTELKLTENVTEKYSKNHSESMTRQNLTLNNLAKHDFASQERSFHAITEAAAHVLDVERTGVWLFNEDRSELICHDLYLQSEHTHDKGTVIKRTIAPGYFMAVQKNHIIAANEAQTDPRVAEFNASYLKPLGITSMLDIGIFLNAELIGVLCIEHVGPLRLWSEEEQSFGTALASNISLAIEANVRRQTEEELKVHQENLEQLVEQRTNELKEREATFNTITAALQSAIIMLDHRGDIVFWNQAAEKLFGWPAEAVIGRNLHKLIVPERCQQDYVSAFGHFKKTGQEDYIGGMKELFALRRNGEEFPIELAISAIKIKDRWHSISVVNDITERKRTDNELRKKMEELVRFSEMSLNREQRMIALKEEINKLLRQTGQDAKYVIVKKPLPAELPGFPGSDND